MSASLEDMLRALPPMAGRNPARARGVFKRLQWVAELIAASGAGEGVPRLLWRDDGGQLQECAVTGAVVIGRSSQCEVVMVSGRVSRRHCRLWRCVGGDVLLEDLESAQGTLLNGVPVREPRLLGDGDMLEVGGRPLLFVLPGKAPSGAAGDRS